MSVLVDQTLRMTTGIHLSYLAKVTGQRLAYIDFDLDRLPDLF